MLPAIQALLRSPRTEVREQDLVSTSRAPLALLLNNATDDTTNKQDISSSSHLKTDKRESKKLAVLDFLFLDTTYCNPTYNFPSQQDVIEATINKVSELLSESKRAQSEGNRRFFASSRDDEEIHSPSGSVCANHGRLLLLFGSYSIGKERLYTQVATRLGLKIAVDSGRLRTLKCLGWPSQVQSLLTTDRTLTPLWVVPLEHISFEKLLCYAADGTVDGSGASKRRDVGPFDTVVGFRPTGWSHTQKGPTRRKGDQSSSILDVRERTVKTSCGNTAKLIVIGAPYSEHSSFPELADCVHQLMPRRVVPTVNCHSESAVDAQLKLLIPSRGVLSC